MGGVESLANTVRTIDSMMEAKIIELSFTPYLTRYVVCGASSLRHVEKFLYSGISPRRESSCFDVARHRHVREGGNVSRSRASCGKGEMES